MYPGLRTSRVILVTSGLVVISFIQPGASAAAADQPSLASCFLRYARLMSDHWLTADLAHQLDRCLFYQPSDHGQEFRSKFDELQRSLASVEQRLEGARAFYRSLNATNSADGLSELARLLDQNAEAESGNETAAVSLLQRVGERSGPGRFQALPVTKEQLAPAWNPRQMIDRNYRPRRILFGSTGKCGHQSRLC